MQHLLARQYSYPHNKSQAVICPVLSQNTFERVSGFPKRFLSLSLNVSSMIRLLISFVLLLIYLNAAAQPVSGTSTVYSQSQMRQARENAEMNSHYENVKPLSSGSGSTSQSNGGAASPYISYSAQVRKDADTRNAFETKKKALGRAIRNGLINRTAEQYDRFMKAAADAGFSKEEAETYFGKNQTAFAQLLLRPHHLIDGFFPGFDPTSLPPVPVKKAKVNSLGNLRTEDIAPGETDIVEVYRILMHTIQYSNSWEEKEQLYHRAIEISTTVARRAKLNYISNSDDLWYSLGYIKYVNGDYGSSVQYFKKCHEVRYVLRNDRQTMSSAVTEKDLFSFLYAGSLLNNDIAEAMAYLNLAVKNGYSGPVFLTHLYMLQGEHAAAIQVVQSHLSKEPNPLIAARYQYYVLGLMLLQKKDAEALLYHNAQPGFDEINSTEELRTNVAMALYNFVLEDEKAPEYKGFQPGRFFRLDLAKQLKPGLRLIVEKSYQVNESFKRLDQMEEDLAVLAGKAGYDEVVTTPVNTPGTIRFYKPNGHTNVVLNGLPHPASFAQVTEEQKQQGYRNFESLANFLAVLKEGILYGYESMFDRTTRFDDLYLAFDTSFGLKYYLRDFSAFEVSRSVNAYIHPRIPVVAGYHTEETMDNAIAYAKKLGKEIKKTMPLDVITFSNRIFFESYVEKKKKDAARPFHYCYRITVESEETIDKKPYYRVILEISRI